jgi:hypothetical protein
VPSKSDRLKTIDLAVVTTFLERDVESCLVAQAKILSPVATDVLPEWFRTFVGLEEAASLIRGYERHWVPGRRWYARMSPQRLTGIAVFIAGRERADLGEEWRAHLREQTGRGLPADQQAVEAVGFVRAAVLCRAEDVEDWLGESVDAVLSSRWMSSLFVLLAMVSIAVVFIRQGGLYGLADNIGGVAVEFATALGVIHVGRKVRDVKPPEHKPRRERRQR